MKRQLDEDTIVVSTTSKKARCGHRCRKSTHPPPIYEEHKTIAIELWDNITVAAAKPAPFNTPVIEQTKRELKWQLRSTAWAKQRQVLEEQIADLTEAFESGDSAATISQLSKENTELWRTVRELKFKLKGLNRNFNAHIRGNKIRYDELLKDRDCLNEQLMELRAKVT